MAGRPSEGWMDFREKLRGYMGDTRNAPYRAASASGAETQRKRRKQGGARVAGTLRIVGFKEPGPRTDNVLGPCEITGKYLEADEMTRRRELRTRALEGNEEALAELRDGYRLTTLVLDGRVLIDRRVLVGAKGTQ